MRTIVIIFLFLLPSLLWGQIINHFTHNDSKWNVARTKPGASQENPFFVATTTTIYGFQGDTTINSKQWLKLYSTNDSLFQNNLVFHGLIRAENNEVFYLDTMNQLDTLYNFSLNIGDSVLFNLSGTAPVWLKVIEVDSIQMNGELYKRLKFEEPEFIGFDKLEEVWIEGIGSIHGPLFSHFPRKFSQEMPDSLFLTCSFSNSLHVWQNPYYANCYVNITLGVDQLETLDFKLFPNPFSDEIHIDTDGTKNYELTLLNSLGQIIRQIELASTAKTIDVSELKAGIYFIRIDNREESRTVKMVKEQ